MDTSSLRLIEGLSRMSFVKHSVDLATAERAIEAAAAKALEPKLAMSIAVVDEAGDLQAFRRMESKRATAAP